MNPAHAHACTLFDISDEDVMAAMRSMGAYIDITPADFREVYKVAYAAARERLTSALTAADIMAAPVHTVNLDTDLIATAVLLAEKGISGAPVTDGRGAVVGVISEKDFMRKMGASRQGSFMEVIAHCLKNKGCLAMPLTNRTAGDLMTTPAVTGTADLSIGRISALMIEKNINRLPVVDAAGKPLGIVTRSDLVNSFCLFG